LHCFVFAIHFSSRIIAAQQKTVSDSVTLSVYAFGLFFDCKNPSYLPNAWKKRCLANWLKKAIKKTPTMKKISMPRMIYP